MWPRCQVTAVMAAAVAVAPFSIAPNIWPSHVLASDSVAKNSLVKAVLSASKLEVDSSKLVLQKSASDDVKAFAEQMIADHTRAGEELWNVISGHGGMFKAAYTEDEQSAVDLSSKDADVLALLEGVDDAEFQSADIALQDKANREAVHLVRSYASHPDDEALGTFARKTLPVLEMHLDHIQKIAATQWVPPHGAYPQRTHRKARHVRESAGKSPTVLRHSRGH